MPHANKALIDRARTIFTELGYSIDGSDTEFTATREWKAVQVVATEDDVDVRSADEPYKCFIVDQGNIDALEHEIRRRDPEYEWAIIGITEDGYDVATPPQ